jgi:hypothetical protein
MALYMDVLDSKTGQAITNASFGGELFVNYNNGRYLVYPQNLNVYTTAPNHDALIVYIDNYALMTVWLSPKPASHNHHSSGGW